MANRYAQIKIEWLWGSQLLFNTLWYVGDAASGAAGAAANNMLASVDDLITPGLINFQSTNMVLQRLLCMVYDASWDKELLSDIPLSTGYAGTRTGNSMGPGVVSVVHYALTPTGAVANGAGKFLHRSHLAWGPIFESEVGEGGEYTPSNAGGIKDNFLEAVSTGNSTSIAGWGDVLPIRVGAEVSGSRAYSYIDAVSFRPMYSFRRSRNNG